MNDQVNKTAENHVLFLLPSVRLAEYWTSKCFTFLTLLWSSLVISVHFEINTLKTGWSMAAVCRWLQLLGSSHVRWRDLVHSSNSQMLFTWQIPRPPCVRRNPSEQLAKQTMASKLRAAAFVLLFTSHICYGDDPQPEQIHISATGRERTSSETLKTWKRLVMGRRTFLPGLSRVNFRFKVITAYIYSGWTDQPPHFDV